MLLIFFRLRLTVLCYLCFKVIVGYLLAGSLIGPGGLKFISEIVQVRNFSRILLGFFLEAEF